MRVATFAFSVPRGQQLPCLERALAVSDRSLAEVFNLPEARVFNTSKAQVFNLPEARVFNTLKAHMFNLPEARVWIPQRRGNSVMLYPHVESPVGPIQNWLLLRNQ